MERKLMLMVFGVPLAALEMFLPGVFAKIKFSPRLARVAWLPHRIQDLGFGLVV